MRSLQSFFWENGSHLQMLNYSPFIKVKYCKPSCPPGERFFVSPTTPCSLPMISTGNASDEDASLAVSHLRSRFRSIATILSKNIHLTMVGPVQVLVGSVSCLSRQDLWNLPNDPRKVSTKKKENGGLMPTPYSSTTSRGLLLNLALTLALLAYPDRCTETKNKAGHVPLLCGGLLLEDVVYRLFDVRGQREVVHMLRRKLAGNEKHTNNFSSFCNFFQGL